MQEELFLFSTVIFVPLLFALSLSNFSGVPGKKQKPRGSVGPKLSKEKNSIEKELTSFGNAMRIVGNINIK
jgi:hypothetical protein